LNGSAGRPRGKGQLRSRKGEGEEVDPGVPTSLLVHGRFAQDAESAPAALEMLM